MINKNKATLYLMTQKGFDVLENLIKKGYSANIDKVVSAKDVRMKKDFYPEIKNICRKHDIPFYDKKDKYAVEGGFQVAVSWRWMIRNADNLIVLHDSILPAYRGFAPLVSSLVRGEREIGVTALFASDEYDMGDIIGMKKVRIKYPLKIQKAIETVSKAYVQLTEKILSDIRKGKSIASKPQKKGAGSYCLWLDEEDYRIDWNGKNSDIKRFIDATGFPYNGASSAVDGRKVRIFDVEPVKDVAIVNRTPGKVIFIVNGMPVVVCGKGLIKIKEASFDDGADLLPLIKFRTRFK